MDNFEINWFVSKMFRGKVDKGGNDYMQHIRSVANRFNMKQIEYKIALLHDIIEDTEMTEGKLRDMFDDEVVDAVVLLTKDKSMTYEEYINRLIGSNNIHAIRVKKADIENNIDLSRLKEITLKDIQRLEKRYIPTYYKIYNKLTELENDL